MTRRVAATIDRPRAEVERKWHSPELRPRYITEAGASVRFADAPGDRGTEVHVELGPDRKLGGLAGRLSGSKRLAKAKDELRRFKQLVETGVIARSDAVPEGELAERKLKQRPAQPLADDEREKAGV